MATPAGLGYWLLAVGYARWLEAGQQKTMGHGGNDVPSHDVAAWITRGGPAKEHRGDQNAILAPLRDSYA